MARLAFRDVWDCRERKGEQMQPSHNGSELTAGQKTLAAYRLTLRGYSDAAAAEVHNTSVRQVEAMRAVMRKLPELEADLESGAITLNAAQVAAGYRQHKPVAGKNFGKGDKWLEVANNMMQYLAGWKNRGYKFAHLPPKEAEKRVKVIDDMIGELQNVRADLVSRAVRATSSAPSR